MERLGVRMDDRGRLVLTLTDEHLRGLGIAHGGVLASLLDSVMGITAARSAPADHYVVTSQLNVHFLRPAHAGDTLTAVAEVVHMGRRTAVARGEIRDEGGSLIAMSSATFVHVLHSSKTRARPETSQTSGQPGGST